ncbi:MAG: hypothetical protein HY665_04645, partial [Chloroflexi bacterium]|nr:hypothetical protein [Chloroflexota bacterium]
FDTVLVVDAIGRSARDHGQVPGEQRATEEQELKSLDTLFEYIEKYQKPVIISGHVGSSMKKSALLAKLREHGIFIYPTPERAAKVIANLARYRRYVEDSTILD